LSVIGCLIRPLCLSVDRSSTTAIYTLSLHDALPIWVVPEVMLSSPLSIGERIIGVIAVRDYKNPEAYVQTDIEILHFISNQVARSEEHTSELQSRENLVCRLLLEKKNTR